MLHMNINAQQAVVDSLSCFVPSKPTVILCHNPSEISAMHSDLVSVGTHDLFDEYYNNDAIQLISVFPNISVVRKVLSNSEELHFNFDCIFACHHGCDPLEVITDICGKFGIFHHHIVDISFLTELKKQTFRNFATTAYRVRVCSAASIGFNLTWKKPSERLDEFLLSKAIAGDPRVKEIANDPTGPLVCKTTKANGCFDFEKGGNLEPLSFRPGNTGFKTYKEELARLVRTCQEVGREMPSAVVQFKERINWKSLRKDGSIERTVLICRNLDHLRIGDFAMFLTTCQIPFYFSNQQTIIINTAGLDSSIMVKLMHYAEVPIPTSMKQGAFSICVKGIGLGSDDRDLLKLHVNIGRIGALPFSPMQIPMRNIRALVSEPLHESVVGKWLKAELSAVNFCETVCLNEEQIADKYLQFHVPIEEEHHYPQEVHVHGKPIMIEHALPFAMPFTTRARPPYEESVHEHWKNSAKLEPSEKRGHVNCITKTEGSSGSFQRQLNLVESSLITGSKRVIAMTEVTEMPWIFFNGQVEDDHALPFFRKYLNKMKNKEDIMAEIEDNHGKPTPSFRESVEKLCLQVLRINCSDDQPLRIGYFHEGKKGWTTCTSELLQCHAYTDCTMILLTPAGCKVSDVCSPMRHISVCKTIVFSKRTVERSDMKNTPTQMGVNPSAKTEPTQPYTQEIVHEKKQKEKTVSPTAPWSVNPGNDNSDDERGRQLPLPKKPECRRKEGTAPSPGQSAKSPRENNALSQMEAGDEVCDKTIQDDPHRGGKSKEKYVTKEEKEVRTKGQIKVTSDSLEQFLQNTYQFKQETVNPLVQVNSDGENETAGVKAPQLMPTREKSQTSPRKGNDYNPHAIGFDGMRSTSAPAQAGDLSIDNQPQSPPISERAKVDKNLKVGQDQDVLMEALEVDDPGKDKGEVPNFRDVMNGKIGGTLPSFPKDHMETTSGNRRMIRKCFSCPPLKRDVSPITKVGNTRLKDKANLTLRAQRLESSSAKPGAKDSSERDRDREYLGSHKTDNDQVAPNLANDKDKVTDMQVCEQGISESTQHIIDVCLQLEQEEKEQKIHRLELVTDAVSKWCHTIVQARQERIIQLGEKFLKDMDSTICFLLVAFRLLSKASWTKTMICIDVRQATLYAISKGWFVKATDFKHFPFTRAELAIAAGSYLGRIPAGKAEDPFFALKIMIDSLPPQCSKLFSSGTLKCPHCGAQCEVAIPSLTSHVTWAMPEWESLDQMLKCSTPIPWEGTIGWHKEWCERSDRETNINEWGPWVLVEMCVKDLTHLPSLQTTLHKHWMSELNCANGQILGYVCSDILSASEGHEHYWFVETDPEKPPFVYDSLQGLCQLTQGLAKKLRVYGVLLSFGDRCDPILHTAELDLVAGIVPALLRKPKTIKVFGRLRAEKIRSFLYKEHGVKRRKQGRCAGSVKEAKAKPAPDKVKKSKKKKSPSAEVRSAQAVDSKGSLMRGKKAGNRTAALTKKQKGNPRNDLNASASGKLSVLFRRQQEARRAIQTPVPDDPIENISDEEFNVHREMDGCEAGEQATSHRKYKGAPSVGHGSVDLLNIYGTVEPPQEAQQSAVKCNPQDDRSALAPSCSDSHVHHPDSRTEAHDAPHGIKGTGAMASPHKHKRGNDRTPECLTGAVQGPDRDQHPSSTHKADPADPCNIIVSSEGYHGNAHSRAKKPRAQEDCILPELTGDPTTAPKQNTGVIPTDPGSPSAHVKTLIECESTTPQAPIGRAKRGAYGIISLFDGVSSVVRTLKQKLNRSPTAVILAENDEKLRGLVCAEFGYRADQKWGFTQDGAACLYVKDVNQLIANDCTILRDTAAAFPGLKWFIIGGSPCQDLTFAGPSQGILGLVGAQSRLFFTLLCVIRTMQVLVGVGLVRYLVENAGSMKDYHFHAFCKLLGLCHKEANKYMWDLLKFTPYISRKRNFFRNFDDTEPVQPIAKFFEDNCGPLLTLRGKIIPLAPLLRTRSCSNFGICHSSWTLYQPHALVWDYSFWGGEKEFAQACRIHDGKIPFLGWDRIVPPPFLDLWRHFIDLLKKGNKLARNFDQAIAPLLPLFNCDTYKLPFRVLREQEVMNFSGLGRYWVNTNFEDSERLPENAIRDMCGNSFHPALISSALGSNQALLAWIDGSGPGPCTFAAGQQQTLATYTELCEVVAREIDKKKFLSKQSIIRDLPNFPKVEDTPKKTTDIQIAPAMMIGERPVEVSKKDRKQELAIEAALYVIEQQACLLFKHHGISQYFDAFRAAICKPFTLDSYIGLSFGQGQGRLEINEVNPFHPNRPVRSLIEKLKRSFEAFEGDKSVSSLLSCLVDANLLKQPTTWPVGHIVLVQTNRKPSIFYVGCSQPKLLLLIDWNQQKDPSIYVLAATAYAEPLALGCVPIAIQEVEEVSMLDQVSQCFIEHRAGHWSIRFGRYRAYQGGCVICFLYNLGVFDFCPWHTDLCANRGHCNQQILHLVAKYQAKGTVNVLGYIDEFPLHCRVLMFHVLSEEMWCTLQPRICWLATPFLLAAHPDGAPQEGTNEETLTDAFQSQNLPSSIFRHFLMRAAGPSDILNSWLQPRSLI